MRRWTLRMAVVVSLCAASGLTGLAQAVGPGTASSSAGTAGGASETPAAVTGGAIRGHVKSGTVPLPGVTVTAQNTLTGKRYSTTTDVTGAWMLTIPTNGRYVLRTQFAAFAPGAQEAVLNATSREQTVDFQLM